MCVHILIDNLDMWPNHHKLKYRVLQLIHLICIKYYCVIYNRLGPCRSCSLIISIIRRRYSYGDIKLSSDAFRANVRVGIIIFHNNNNRYTIQHYNFINGRIIYDT